MMTPRIVSIVGVKTPTKAPSFLRSVAFIVATRRGHFGEEGGLT
ncbi:uncharacterized protein METZ01_LOCUS336834, partial [marine metagenome]